MRIELTVTMNDGVVHHVVCKGPKGTWGMPPLRDEDHLVKLRDCFGRALPAAQMDEALAGLDHLDRLSADGVRNVLQLIAGKPRVIRGRIK
jgi:hypothetical protein